MKNDSALLESSNNLEYEDISMIHIIERKVLRYQNRRDVMIEIV